MTADPSQHDTGAGPAAPQTGEEEAATGIEAGADLTAYDETQIRQIIAALQDENEKLRAVQEAERDQALRARAELENFRRRTEREKADTAKFAITKFAADIVGVADNFERAIKSVPEGATADNPTLKALLEGVVMTEREFLVALERHGVKRVTPFEEPFNPHLHQAVMEVEHPTVPAGTCVQVFQHGYTIEERILRPAMVAVSRGGPKAPKPADVAPDAAPNVAPDAPAPSQASPEAPGQPAQPNGNGGDGQGPSGSAA